jgi:hypothetical protein
MLNPNLFEVTREADRWVCRPSTLFVHFSVLLGAGMSAFLVYLAWTFFRDDRKDENVWVGTVILVLAVFVSGLAVWRWLMGRTALIVERSGRVCYGAKELCSAGEVRTIRLVPLPGEDGYDVCLVLHEGTRRVVPGFAYGSREGACAFAQELAAELGVTVEDAS